MWQSPHPYRIGLNVVPQEWCEIELWYLSRLDLYQTSYVKLEKILRIVDMNVKKGNRNSNLRSMDGSYILGQNRVDEFTSAINET